jgi:hypothetical protein
MAIVGSADAEARQAVGSETGSHNGQVHFWLAAMQQNVGCPTRSRDAAAARVFPATLKGPMIHTEFGGHLENPGVIVPLVLKGL